MDSGRRPSRRSRRLLVVGGFVLLVIVIAIVVAAALGSRGDDGSPSPSTPAEIRTVDIPPGVAADDVAKILEREGIVKSAAAFLAAVKEAGADADLKPGRYDLPVDGDLPRIVQQLTEGGRPSGIRVTFPEGLSIDQAAARLDEAGAAAGAEYQRLAHRPQDFTLPRVGGSKVSPESLEGLLFPDTYFVEEGAGAGNLIQQQLTQFEQRTADLPWENATELGVDPYDVVTVASLIEKEARLPEERAKVASVIYNRLRKKMPLGIDATVRYALTKWTGPLTKSDMEVDSPYNTRRYKGLPPGPIASPGKAALEAALEPEQSGYLYYVLIDEAGHHFFTDSYDAFLKAKEKAPQAP